MPYTYLMAWFALHCPAIIQSGKEPKEGVRFVHLRRFEKSQWLRTYIGRARNLIRRYDVSPSFPMLPLKCKYNK